MKLTNKVTLLALILVSTLVNVLITSKSIVGNKLYLKKLSKKKSTKYTTQTRLDFFTQETDKFPGKYVYNFGEAGTFEAINSGNPIPIKDTDQHSELGRGSFGRIAIVKGKDGKEYIVKLMDVNKNEVFAGNARKTIQKSIAIMEDQDKGGKSEYIMKYHAAKTYKCLGYHECAALLLEKIEGKELWSFMEKK